MIRRLGLIAVFGLLFGFAVTAGLRSASATTWTDTHCDTSPDPQNVGFWKHSQAQSYALVGRFEGYEWGGGCWNDNQDDDTPNQPDSDGEGPDCSGFVFKTWALSKNTSVHDYRYWTNLDAIHGPYQAWEIRDGTGDAISTISKSYGSTFYMDAFASSSHTGMIYSEEAQGQDRVIEALGDSSGTGLWYRYYRIDSDFGASPRGYWSSECEPHCGG